MIVNEDGIDIAHDMDSVLASSTDMDITFQAVPSTPNPYKDMALEWSYGEENDMLPYGVRQEESFLIFATIFESKEQSGTYSVSFGNYTESFRLDVQGMICRWTIDALKDYCIPLSQFLKLKINLK